jgi:NADPH2:quinone reductase
MQTTAIQIRRHGGPEMLEVATVDLGEPGPGQVRLRQTAIGLNFADIYQRKGAHGPHQAATFPITLGAQGAGVVEALGAGVERVKVGDEVAYIEPGAYQAVRNVDASRLVVLPAHFGADLAGAALLRGLTAEYLLRRLYVVKPGDAVLVHAAAGGMGVILSQWARALGATVIGTVGSDEKMRIALDHGCHNVVNYRSDDFVKRTLEWTDGAGVAVVYDAVGKDVFVPSLDCLRPMGIAINYGTASGDVTGFDLQRLHAKSLSIARPTLRTYIAKSEDLQMAAAALFAVAGNGDVRFEVNRRYALTDVRRAHEELESRTTTGAAILVP